MMNEAEYKPKVLVVDADESVRNGLTTMLASEGFEVVEVATAAEGRAKAQEGGFAVAIVDDRLPDGCGLDIIRPLREASPDISVVMITAHASAETAIEAVNRGACGFLTKPLDYGNVLAKVADCVGRYQLTRQNRLLHETLRHELAERTRAQEALRENSALLERIFDNTHILIAYLDADFNFIRVNRAYAEAGGQPPEWFVGRNHFVLYPHGENERIFRRVVKTGEPFLVYEKPFTYPDKPDWVTYWDWSLQPIRGEDGRVSELVLCLLDATERMHGRQELRSLASQLSIAEERERRRMAAALHDYIGQSLALSQIMLGSLKNQVPSKECAESVDQVRELIDKSLEDTRALIFDLSPPILYEVGLDAALERLVEENTKRYGVETSFLGKGNSKNLDEATRVVLFQAVRELLVNAVRHASANHISVSTCNRGNELLVTVTDNGVGFSPPTPRFKAGRDGGFGLFNISERMDSLGGRLDLYSRPGQGTSATLAVRADRPAPDGGGARGG